MLPFSGISPKHISIQWKPVFHGQSTSRKGGLLAALAAVLLLALGQPAIAYDAIVQPSLLEGGLAATNGIVHAADVAYSEETALFGYSIDTAATAQRDLWLLAATAAHFTGTAREDLRALARAVTIGGTVYGNAAAYANGIQLTTNAHVRGDLLLSAPNILADGTVDGDTILLGSRVRLAGTYHGNVRLQAAHATVAPSTIVDGKLVWDCPESPAIPPAATIGELEDRSAANTPPPSLADRLFIRFRIALAFFIAFLLLGVPFLRLFPLHAAATLTQMQTSPLMSILIGLLLLLVLPFAGVLLLMTGYGAAAGIGLFLLLALTVLHSPVLLAALMGHAMLRGRPAPIFKVLALGLLLLALLLALFPAFTASLFAFGAVYSLGAFARMLFRPPALPMARPRPTGTPPPIPPAK